MSDEFICQYCGMALPSADTFHDLQCCAEHLHTEVARLSAEVKAQGTCKWTLVDDEWNNWEGECGYSFVLEAGEPIEHDMRYCPGCGKQLEQLSPEGCGEE